jgi:hypothetical protein
MKLHPRRVLGLIALVLVMATLACSGVTTPAPTPQTGQPTSVVILITATPPQEPGSTPVPPTAAATAVQSGGCTLNLAYVADLTISDGTAMTPGNAFVKTWRVRNSGTCEWKDGTQLVFADGEQMRGPAAVNVPLTAPNATADISVNLVAPGAPGKYAARWRMRSPEGTVYGTLTVVIVIPGTPTAVPTNTPEPTDTPSPLTELFNFHDKAGSAIWTSTSGALTYPGTVSDTQGFVVLQDGQKLHDNNTFNRILETRPTWVTAGFVQGLYTVGEIKPGDRFRTRVGFLYGAGVTEGKVTFIIRGGDGTTVGSFGATRQNAIIPIDLDLAPLAGKTNQIILRVEANNADAAQDWACWVNPRLFGTR